MPRGSPEPITTSGDAAMKSRQWRSSLVRTLLVNHLLAGPTIFLKSASLVTMSSNLFASVVAVPASTSCLCDWRNDDPADEPLCGLYCPGAAGVRPQVDFVSIRAPRGHQVHVN